jgi:hypothetical protein
MFKKKILFYPLFFTYCSYVSIQAQPVKTRGKLSVKGISLADEHGKTVMLLGGNRKDADLKGSGLKTRELIKSYK